MFLDSPTPDIEWLPLTGNMDPSHRHFDEYKKILRIENVNEDDDGEYECIAKNSEGDVRHKYIVTVECKSQFMLLNKLYI